jgi:hypothetical protein
MIVDDFLICDRNNCFAQLKHACVTDTDCEVNVLVTVMVLCQLLVSDEIVMVREVIMISMNEIKMDARRIKTSIGSGVTS